MLGCHSLRVMVYDGACLYPPSNTCAASRAAKSALCSAAVAAIASGGRRRVCNRGRPQPSSNGSSGEGRPRSVLSGHGTETLGFAAQVTTPGNKVAAQYLYDEALKLQAFAAEHRPDLDVHVRPRSWPPASSAAASGTCRSRPLPTLPTARAFMRQIHEVAGLEISESTSARGQR